MGFRLCARGAQQQAAQQEAGEKNRDLAVPLGMHAIDYKAIFGASQAPGRPVEPEKPSERGKLKVKVNNGAFVPPSLFPWRPLRPSRSTLLLYLFTFNLILKRRQTPRGPIPPTESVAQRVCAATGPSPTSRSPIPRK